MSGPKVINIEAIRRQQERAFDRRLRQLENAIATWRDSCRKAGTLDETADAAAVATLERFEAMRNVDLRRALNELPGQIQFYQAEDAAARKAVVERARSVRERRRRIELAAAAIQRELQDSNNALSTDLCEVATRAGTAGDAELAQLEAVVQRKLESAAQARGAREGKERQERLVKLAAEFRGSATPITLRAWLAAQAGGARPDKDDRLTNLLAEVEAWGEPDDLAPFLDRARLIPLEPDKGRRELLTDSLILELSEYRRSQRRRTELKHRLQEALAVLEPFRSAEAAAWRMRVEREASGGMGGAEALVAEVEAWCAAEEKREDAELRRRAVLSALSDLGYEVREGMAVAWAEEGRIVVQKPGDTNYGVELVSPGDASALQARVVAFDYTGRGEGDRQREKEVEEAWCSDLGRMQEMMKSAGCDAQIRKATPPGAVRLKVVPGLSMPTREAPSTASSGGQRAL
jgi:hypothetical protein